MLRDKRAQQVERQASVAQIRNPGQQPAVATEADKFSKILLELRSKSEETRAWAAQALGKYLTQQARNFSPESYSRLISDLTNQIFELANSPHTHEKLGSILAIEEVIESEKNAGTSTETTLVNLGNYLRICFRSTDLPVLAASARALGKLVRYFEGVLPPETLDLQAQSFLDALDKPKGPGEPRKAALLALRELAANSRTLFLTHLSSFFEKIWQALRERDVRTRFMAAETFSAALVLIAERDNRGKYYRKIWEDVLAGLDGKEQKEENLHGSVLAVGELLLHAKDFMQERHQAACDLILKLRDSRFLTIKRSVILLLSRLASSCPEFFSHNHLSTCIGYLLEVIKRRDEFRGIAFIAAGEIAQAVGGYAYKFVRFLNQLIDAIKEALAPPQKGKPNIFCEEAVQCAVMLCQVYGSALRTNMAEIIPMLFNGGLTEVLADSLAKLAVFYPKLLPIIQERLLTVLSESLTGLPFKEAARSGGAAAATSNSGLRRRHSIVRDTGTVALSLRILGSFDFTGHYLGDFLREHLLPYLDDMSSNIRRETVFTLAKVTGRLHESEATKGYVLVVHDQLLEKILIQSISDPDPAVRRVLGALDSRYDAALAGTPENLRYLFIALNDERFDIREMALAVIGRIAIRNPTYVMPSLRKTLTQLLAGLEFGGDDQNKEENVRLLAALIRASGMVIKPHVPAILAALLPKLTLSSPSVASAVLIAIGEVAAVGGELLLPHLNVLLPIVVENLQDTNNEKREIAIRTLGQFIEATGQSILPYSQYPTLLPTLLHLVQQEQIPSIRADTLKALGALGALDPYKHKLNSKMLESKESRTADALSAPAVLPGTVASDEDYSGVVAVTGLMRILGDPALVTHYPMAIQSVLLILRSLGPTKAIPMLRYIMPPYLSVIETADMNFTVSLLEHLMVIVAMVKAQIAPYVDELLQKTVKYLSSPYWAKPIFPACLDLILEVQLALDNEFTSYLPTVMAPLLKILSSSDTGAIERALYVLELIGTANCSMDDYLHLLVPALVNLLDSPHVRVPGLKTFTRLCAKLNFSDYASRMVHPLVRLLGEAPDIRPDIFEALCALAYQLSSDFAIFIPIVAKAMATYSIISPLYDNIITSLLKNQPVAYEYPRVSERKAVQVSFDAQDDKKVSVNTQNLQNAWESTQRLTKDDWAEWIRKLTMELIQESPSRALKACASLAQVYQPLARELFYAAFFATWQSLNEQFRALFVSSLMSALNSSRIGTDVLQVLLNLAEFMEHDDKPLPIDIARLGTIAEKCQADAKALHYREMEFHISQEPATVEALIEIYNRLQHYEAAHGIVVYAQTKLGIELKEMWFEKLQRWEEALMVYFKKTGFEAAEGKMRALSAMAEWEKLLTLVEDVFPPLEQPTEDLDLASSITSKADGALQEDQIRRDELKHKDKIRAQVAPYGAEAAFQLGKWSFFETCVNQLEPNSVQGSFYRAIMHVQKEAYTEARRHIDVTRKLLDVELTSRVNESYDRAYSSVLSVQRLVELEEVIDYKQASDADRRTVIRQLWNRRNEGCQQTVEVWRSVLSVRQLAVAPTEDAEEWLAFASLCRRSGNLRLSRNIILKLLGKDTVSSNKAKDVFAGVTDMSKFNPWVCYAYFKQIWAEGDRQGAYDQLKRFTTGTQLSDGAVVARCNLHLGRWLSALVEQNRLDDRVIAQGLQYFQAATKSDPTWYKACHSWALANFEAIAHYEKTGNASKIVPHLEPAVRAFFRSIALGPSRSLQDVLRLLTLWFRHGSHLNVQTSLREGFAEVSIDTWLQVIPQIIARINLSVKAVRTQIAELLQALGREHPQALVSPLTVASKSSSESRKVAALRLLDHMRQHSARLIDETIMVSQELIRVSVLWAEQWHAALEEASRFYFSEGNYEAMFEVLAPLHAQLEAGPSTQSEAAFSRAYGRDLQEAYEWCRRYSKSKRKADLSQAWDIYYQVFRVIAKQLPTVKSVHLRSASPRLLEARDLQLAIPGSYEAGRPIVRIASFKPVLTVISSKQRPRKIEIRGSDEKFHLFLLKGHEDTRQDERVMQLFSLVNTLFSHDPDTSKSHVSIRLYSVTPLSPHSGLIGWVGGHDTLNALITEYRESRGIPLKVEMKFMHDLMPAYDPLSLIQKVEVFEHGLTATPGNDLQRVLWLRSRNSEVWLEKRLTYTRSMAVMSMVGYILGLGDRHPSNIMLERTTGKILHIDFGDCFEVAMLRDKYPEKVPFRLTRMLVNAMEASGIEGNYRMTCERVMKVLRDNKESLMAVLEAFVYDPLINWKLLAGKDKDKEKKDADGTSGGISPGLSPQTASKLNDEADSFDGDSDAPAVRESGDPMADAEGFVVEVLNEKALTIVDRINKKLTGRDFSNNPTALSVNEQVDKLIIQATTPENLSCGYMGWMPFW